MNVFEEIEKNERELMPVKISEPEIVEGDFLKIEKLECVMQDGSVIIREEVIKKKKNAVVILPVTKEGKILLVQQFRIGARRVTVEVPAGYIESCETSKEAAKREMEEETGYIPTDGIYCFEDNTYQDPAANPGINDLYIALGCEKVKDQCLDEDEHLRFVECTVEELYEIIRKGYIKSQNIRLTISLGMEPALNYINNIRRKKIGS